MMDFLHNGGEPQIAGGDWVTGDSRYQHQQDLLGAYPGAYKQAPMVGPGLEAWLLSEVGSEFLRQLARQALGEDGLPNDVSLNSEKEQP